MTRQASLPPGTEAALTAWLPRQRWYAAKGRPIRDIRIAHTVPLAVPRTVDGPHGILALLHVNYRDGGPPDFYQTPLAIRRLSACLSPGTVITEVGGLAVYDALEDPDVLATLLRLIKEDAQIAETRFRSAPDAKGLDLDALPTPVLSRPLGVEQSNSSVVVGERYLLKFFRRISLGPNPDVELQSALQRTGSPHIPRLWGSIEGRALGSSVTYAILQAYEPHAQDAWSLAQTDAHSYLNGSRSTFVAEAERIGQAVAAVHHSLVDAFGSARLRGDDIRRLTHGMLGRFEEACRIVPELVTHQAAVRSVFHDMARLRSAPHAQRIHGDLHLGQVLRTPDRWLLIDFEGEPGVPIAERRTVHPPLRDVAGMLRSLDYAAAHTAGTVEEESAGLPRQAARAARWAARCGEAFLRGYSSQADAGRTYTAQLLRAYQLDKALYEVVYETRNRPSWRHIPLQAIARLTAAPGQPAALIRR
ncbi:maltokinase N-terminal cap-like domain-containing protein [Streptomyces lydicus]